MIGPFKRKVTPHKLGEEIYKNIRFGVMSTGTVLSKDYIIDNMEEERTSLPGFYIFEILIGLMFGADIAVRREFDRGEESEIAKKIMDGVNEGFTKHAAPALSGASTEEIEKLLMSRFQEYRECLNSTDGAGPKSNMGRKFYWNVVGSRKENDTIAERAGHQIDEATEMVEEMIKKRKLK